MDRFIPYLFCLSFFVMISCSSTPVKDPSGNEYLTIKLNGKNWLTQNLNFKVPDSWCYGDDENNCSEYGRLYTWEAAKNACEALGDGWRLPTDREWKELLMKFGGYYDKEEKKGEPMKAYDLLTQGGNSHFEASLGGYYFREDYEEYLSLYKIGLYWSGTRFDENYAWRYLFSSTTDRLERNRFLDKHGLSCRCVKD